MAQEKLERLVPALAVPLTFRLTKFWPKPFTSKFEGKPPEYRFDVHLGEKDWMMYLPLEGRNAIVETGAANGDVIWFLKRQDGFDAQLVSDAQEPQETTPPQVPQKASGVFRERLAPALAERGVAIQNGHHSAVPLVEAEAVPPPTVPPRTVYPVEEQWFEALKMGLHAWERLRLYAQEIGAPPVEYTSEDIRCVATTTKISYDQRNGRG